MLLYGFCRTFPAPRGGIAQLVERLNGIQEAVGSNPSTSTIFLSTKIRVGSPPALPSPRLDLINTTQHVPSSLISLQRRYWNKLAPRYQRQMVISSEDFHYGPQLPGESQLKLLPPLGKHWNALELGCGGAQNSIWLAKQGVSCTAVDISEKQLHIARDLAAKENVAVNFKCFALEELGGRIRDSFHLIHSSHALEFVDSPAEVIKNAAELLHPGGWLVLSTVHPLYNGEWVESLEEDGVSTRMGMFLSSYFNPPDDIRKRGEDIEAVSRAYSISDWCDWLCSARLAIMRLAEPAAVAEGAFAPYTSRAWAQHGGQLHAFPATLIITAQKRAT